MIVKKSYEKAKFGWNKEENNQVVYVSPSRDLDLEMKVSNYFFLSKAK